MLLASALLLSGGCGKVVDSVGQYIPLANSDRPNLNQVQEQELGALLERERLALESAQGSAELQVAPIWDFDEEAHQYLRQANKQNRTPAQAQGNSQKTYYIKLKYTAPHDDILRADGRFFSGWGSHYVETQRLIKEAGYVKYCEAPAKQSSKGACPRFGLKKRKDFARIKEKIEKRMKVVGVYGKGETFKVVYRKLEIQNGSPNLRKPASAQD